MVRQPNYAVNFWKLCMQLLVVALGHASCNDQQPTSTFLFIHGQMQYRLNGFFLRSLNKAASINNDDLRIFLIYLFVSTCF